MNGTRSIALLDHEACQAQLRLWRSAEKIQYRACYSYESLLHHLECEDWPLVIVDVPSISGMGQLSELSRQLIATDRRSQIVLLLPGYCVRERSRALAQGADWVIELDGGEALINARLDAVIRRYCSLFTESAVNWPPYHLFRESLEVQYLDHTVKLSQLDFRLLEYLFSSPGKAHSRTSLLRNVWNLHSPENERRVDTKISQLRTRLNLNGQCGWELRYNRCDGGYVLAGY